MIQKNPIQTAQRLNRRRELGRCIQCGRADKRIEQHHVAGRNHVNDLTVPLCGTCHDAMTEKLRSGGIEMRKTENPVESVARALKAISIYKESESKTLRELAEKLEQTLKEVNK